MTYLIIICNYQMPISEGTSMIYGDDLILPLVSFINLQHFQQSHTRTYFSITGILFLEDHTHSESDMQNKKVWETERVSYRSNN